VLKRDPTESVRDKNSHFMALFKELNRAEPYCT
jgi:hypothetical protein